jgi:hypothetical protein
MARPNVLAMAGSCLDHVLPSDESFSGKWEYLATTGCALVWSNIQTIEHQFQFNA